MRLIDADAMHDEICERINRFRALGKDSVVQNYDFASTVVGDAPTVDAVPVVRCRECRYYVAVTSTKFVCGHPGGMRFAFDSDYCSLGERCSNQSADVRNMGQVAAPGKTGGPNDADQH